MTATELSIFLLTTFDAEGKEAERLVKAETAHAARATAVHVCKASATDVARVLGAGGKVEEKAQS
jgi:hypothetical protein